MASLFPLLTTDGWRLTAPQELLTDIYLPLEDYKNGQDRG